MPSCTTLVRGVCVNKAADMTRNIPGLELICSDVALICS